MGVVSWGSVGGTACRPSRRRRRRRFSIVSGAALLLAACGSDDAADDREVGAADVYTAVVRWELGEHPPTTNEAGEEELPVIYLASSGGGTVDVGVQADVVEATNDEAVVRFADDGSEAIDADEPGEPVKDDGVMFIVGAMEDGETTIDIVVDRYRSLDDDVTLRMRITATSDGADVISALEN